MPKTRPQGFRNGELRRDVWQLLARPAHDLSPGQMTYQLRRLRLRGLIIRIPGTQRYEVTDSGQRMALFWLGSSVIMIVLGGTCWRSLLVWRSHRKPVVRRRTPLEAFLAAANAR